MALTYEELFGELEHSWLAFPPDTIPTDPFQRSITAVHVSETNKVWVATHASTADPSPPLPDNYALGGIQRWSDSGTLEARFNVYDAGVGIVADLHSIPGTDDIIIIRGYPKPRAERWSSAGVQVAVFGEHDISDPFPPPPGKLASPQSLVCDGQHVWITDSDRRLTGPTTGDFIERVMQFTVDGVFVREFGSHGGAMTQFRTARSIGIGPNGTLFVGDSWTGPWNATFPPHNTGRILNFTKDGIWLGTHGNPDVPLFELGNQPDFWDFPDPASHPLYRIVNGTAYPPDSYDEILGSGIFLAPGPGANQTADGGVLIPDGAVSYKGPFIVLGFGTVDARIYRWRIPRPRRRPGYGIGLGHGAIRMHTAK